MSGQLNLWTADAISAAATALSFLLAAIVFTVDRASAWSRRRADASRLSKLIAGDLGLELARLRSVSSHLNALAIEDGLAHGLELLASKPGSERVLETFLSKFDTARIDRICETTNVFDPVMSDHLSSVITLKSAALESVRILASIEADDPDRAGIAKHVCIQANALQTELLGFFNATLLTRGVGRLQRECVISTD